jgi:hypothetical protein
MTRRDTCIIWIIIGMLLLMACGVGAYAALTWLGAI